MVRQIKVEPFQDGQKRQRRRKAMLRLKGAWLAEIFQPGAQVVIRAEPGRIVIERQ